MLQRITFTGRAVFPLLLFALLFPIAALAEELPFGATGTPLPEGEIGKYLSLELEPDAYYTSLDLTAALTTTPIPHVGRQSEKELYLTLLSRAYMPRFLVLEGSVNPLPYAGTYIKKHHPGFYEDAQVTGSFNWVQAVTAGFEEPYALSAFLGNVVDFSVEDRKDTKGKGYSGLLYSFGSYQIKDNTLIRDDWWEAEWKVKGDLKTPDRKLSWSFRVGAKLHGNPGITDIYYLSFRRSRLDYTPERDSIFNNSGFEYTVDLKKNTFTPIRHYFFVEKKWPIEGKKMAFALATGFVWESADKYSGELAAGRTSSSTQIILRPNIEF